MPVAALFLTLLASAGSADSLLLRASAAINSGQVEEGLSLADRAQRTLHDAGNRRGEASLLMRVARDLKFHGDHALALEKAEEAIEIATELGDQSLVGFGLTWSGWILAELGHYGVALVVLKQAHEIGIETKQPVVEGLSGQEMGNIYRRLAKLKEAEQYVTASMAIAKEINVPSGFIEGHTILAEVDLTRGLYSSARQRLGLARAEAERIGYHEAVAITDEVLGRVELAARRPTPARSAFERAESLGRKHAVPSVLAAALLGRAQLEADAVAAYTLAVEALEIYSRIHDEDEGWAMAHAGAALAGMEHTDHAQLTLDQALELATSAFSHEREGFIQSKRSFVARLKGDARKELVRQEAAVSQYTAAKNLEQLWRAERELGHLYSDFGNPQQAVAHYAAALGTLQRLHPEPNLVRLTREREEAIRGLIERLAEVVEQTPDGGSEPPLPRLH